MQNSLSGFSKKNSFCQSELKTAAGPCQIAATKYRIK